ncbi:ribosome hibernation-promoting factor, HPF/YfiA family [Lutibaculum baratangense]|uniref:Ribosome hibernation promoting factor n=1 Tax=Lutibaculum baratangense AMV1 TaxID=631454 RepID=V4R1W6_9HYPH|nr:ribosome-associated translation inhibitor RaiA [Lutibaculum baratangense]ESR25902.1 Ribosomal subunit interface protein [Lutibaculum baratangense AMV1]
MQLRVTGKNIDVGDALRDQVRDRLDSALGKYFDGGASVNVTVERERSGFKTDCRVHLDSGMDLQSTGQAGDAYQSFDQAAVKLEKRLRRYNRRLKDHHKEFNGAEAVQAASYVIASGDEETEEDETPLEDNPVVIAESQTAIRSMTVGMAVMSLDLSDAPVCVFHNVASGRLNIVYRRSDGHVGWIDPPHGSEQGARG